MTDAPRIPRGLVLALVLAPLAPLGAQDASAPPLPAHPREIPLPPPRAYQPPAPTAVELEGGARLFVLEDRELPLVDGLLVFHAGSAFDPADRVGLTELQADVLRAGGSEATDGEALDLRLDRLGARITVEAGREELRIALQCVAEDLPEVAGHVRALLVAPAYPEAVLERARVRRAADLRRRADDAGLLAEQALAQAALGADSPWARVPTVASLARIERADLLATHRARLGPDRLVIGFAGAIDEETARETARTLLEGLAPVGPAPELPAASFLQPAETRVLVVDRPGVPQTELRLGAPGVRRRNQDAAALELWSWVTGYGGMTNRAMLRVRTELGLAYHVGALWRTPLSRQGMLWGVCATANATVHEALDALLDVLRRGLDPIPAEELETARARLLNAEVFELATPPAVLARAVELALADYPQTFPAEHDLRLRRLGPPEVAEAVARHLDLARLWITAVGPAAEIAAELAPFGPVTLVDARGREVASPAPETPLERLFDAVGGRARWADLEWLETEERLVVEPIDAARLELVIVRLQSMDGRHLRVEQRLGTARLVSVLAPDGAWRVDADGAAADLSAREATSLRAAADRTLPRVLHGLAVGALDARASGADALAIRTSEGTALCRLELADTGLPARLTWKADGAGEQTARPVTFRLEEWSTDGEWPHPTRLVREPQGTLRHVVRLEPRESVDRELFQRP